MLFKDVLLNFQLRYYYEGMVPDGRNVRRDGLEWGQPEERGRDGL